MEVPLGHPDRQSFGGARENPMTNPPCLDDADPLAGWEKQNLMLLMGLSYLLRVGVDIPALIEEASTA